MPRRYDVWFTRFGDRTYMGIAEPGEPPTEITAIRVSVGQVLRNISNGSEINQVGIATPDMMGLTDIEI